MYFHATVNNEQSAKLIIIYKQSDDKLYQNKLINDELI